MKKLILATTLALGFTSMSQAQITFAPEGGLNVSNYSLKAGSLSLNTKARAGVRLGVVVDIPLSSNFHLQPGLMCPTGKTQFFFRWNLSVRYL